MGHMYGKPAFCPVVPTCPNKGEGQGTTKKKSVLQRTFPCMETEGQHYGLFSISPVNLFRSQGKEGGRVPECTRLLVGGLVLGSLKSDL